VNFYLVKKHYYANYFDEANMTLQTKKTPRSSLQNEEVSFFKKSNCLSLSKQHLLYTLTYIRSRTEYHRDSTYYDCRIRYPKAARPAVD
jgi:hypothetical protein